MGEKIPSTHSKTPLQSNRAHLHHRRRICRSLHPRNRPRGPPAQKSDHHHQRPRTLLPLQTRRCRNPPHRHLHRLPHPQTPKENQKNSPPRLSLCRLAKRTKAPSYSLRRAPQRTRGGPFLNEMQSLHPSYFSHLFSFRHRSYIPKLPLRQ